MASTGILQQALADYQLSTGDVHLIARDQSPLNIAGALNYPVFDHWAFLQKEAGGDRLDLFFTTGGNESYKRGAQSGETRSPSKRDKVVKGWGDFVLNYGNAAWYDKEIEHNTGLMTEMRLGSARDRFEIIFGMMAKTYAQAEFDLVEGTNEDYLAAPDFSTMESSATAIATRWKSFFSLLNEDYYGMYGVITSAGKGGSGSAGTDYVTSVKAGGAVGTGLWATVQGQDPDAAVFQRSATNGAGSMYAPTQVTYSTTVAAAANSSTNIIAAIKEAKRQSNYTRPPTVFRDGRWVAIGEDEDLYLAIGNKGMNEIESGVLAGQDLWVTEDRQDPTVKPHFGRSRLHYWKRLDTIPLYNGSTGTIKVREGVTTADRLGPRCYGYRKATFFPFVHEANNFRERVMPLETNTPDTHVTWIDLEGNLAMTDRRPHFVVSPSTTVYTAY